jgi:hypothetical protein
MNKASNFTSTQLRFWITNKGRRKTYSPDMVFSAGLESLQSITAVRLE